MSEKEGKVERILIFQPIPYYVKMPKRKRKKKFEDFADEVLGVG